jgi:uncharacterized membrane protein
LKRENPRDLAPTLDERVLHRLEKYGAMNVQDLHEALRSENSAHTKKQTADIVWKLAAQGKAQLEFLPVKTFADFVRSWARNLWFYASITIPIATLCTIYIIPSNYPLPRLVLGSTFVFLGPGFATVEALFPRVGQLALLEQITFSIGSSLSLLMFDGFLLNYTSWGINLLSTVTSLTIITIAMSLVGLVRKFADLTKTRSQFD